MLEVKSLCKSFGSHCVLDHLSITLGTRGITVIVGLNGSGKTVFLDSVAGIIQYDKGNVSLDGHAVAVMLLKQIAFISHQILICQNI